MVPTLKISNENRVSVVQDNQETKAVSHPYACNGWKGLLEDHLCGALGLVGGMLWYRE